MSLLAATARLLPIMAQSCSSARRAGVSTKSSPILRNLEKATELADQIRPRLPRRSVELLDAGALRDLSISVDGRLVAPTFRTIIQDTPPTEQRHETVAAFNALLRHVHVALKCCTACLYPRMRCVCDRVTAVAAPQRANLWVFQHVAEFGRANNSGSLLCLIAGANRALRGIREDEEALLGALKLAHCKESACILFPTATACDVTKFIDARRVRLGPRKAQETPLCTVVLDGTGRQARNLERFLPAHIPRVKLPEAESLACRSWLNPVRMQTEAHRVCSAQAAAGVLALMGEIDAAAAIEHAVHVVVGDAMRDRQSLPKGASRPIAQSM